MLSSWPQALQTVAGLMLRSKTPVLVAWGPDLCLLYNDACADILGQKHPAALGQPLHAVWSELRADIEPLVNQTLAGESVSFENACFTRRCNGADEQAWFSISSAPVDGPDGQAAGVYCTLSETTASVLAERRQQAHTRWLCSLFEQAPGFMAVVRGPDHVYELANRAYQQLVGCYAVVGKPFRALGCKTDGPDYGALLDQVQASGTAFTGSRMPVRFSHQTGGPAELRFIDFVFQPISGPDGGVSGVFIEGHDVTAHARAEDALQASQRCAQQTAQHLDALLQAAPVGILLADADGTLLRSNPAYRKIWGNPPLNRKAGDLVEWKAWWADNSERHGQRLEPRQGALARALRGEEEAPRDLIEIEPFGQPGVRRTVLNCGAPVRDAEGKITGSVIAQMDISDRVQIEAQLRASVARYQIIANALPQIIWSAQPNGCHDYYNQQWYDYTGIAHGAADGEGWRALVHPDDHGLATTKWQHSLATGEPYEIEYRLRHHTGQYRWALGRARPIRDAHGAISRWMGSCTDIHEQKLAQQSLQQSDRRKDEFLAMLAHELRNPLAPIMTAADLLSRSTPGESGVRQLSEVIARQARHMTRLIDDLLDASRVTRGQVSLAQQPVDMNTIAAEALEQIRPLLEGKAHHLDLRLPAEPAWVLGDRPRLVQVLVNVLGNAIRYTASGGRIALQMSVQGGQLTLGVQDNGIGMSGELVEVAFELFTQGERSADRSQGGLGIGLALVRSLVRLHGGTVALHSAGMGLGSQVTILLPCLAHADGPPPAATASAAPAGRRLRIMVVDDNADAARLLGMFLEMLGHEVQVQFHPAAAIDCARKLLPELCLLDIGLPDMDGYTLARQLRLIPGMQTATLATVTGYSQPRDRQAAFAAGFDFHFAKPIDCQQLEAWLAGVAAAPAATAA
ncbi:MAG: PAS domain-containing protein [Polaromonas sp.]|nr:PAS domain-containing protein [Polaromonas sp.]